MFDENVLCLFRNIIIMKKHQIVSLVVAVLLFTISISLPIELFFKMNFGIGLLFAIPTSFFIFCSLYKTERFVDIFFSENLNKSQSKVNIILGVLLVFILTFVNYAVSSQKLETQFKENGVVTKAEILGGHSETITRKGRKTTVNYLQISFIDSISGEKIKGKSHIDSRLVRNIGRYSTIQVIYLKNNPKVFRILDTEEELNKYEINLRELNFDDFKVIKDLKTPEEVLNYVSGFDSSWGLQEEEGLSVLENSRLNMRLVFENTDKMYLLSDNKLKDFIPKEAIIEKIFVNKKDIGLEEDEEGIYSEKGIKVHVKEGTYIAETEFYVVAYNIDCYLQGTSNNCEEQLIFERK